MKFFRYLLALMVCGFATFAQFGTNAQTTDIYFSEETFEKWKFSNNSRPQIIHEFEQYLLRNHAFGILPTYQILRTASMAQECKSDGFDIPPHQYWPNIVKTLRFIQIHIVPELGRLEAVSAYRNPQLNECAGGAKTSAHSQYFALDLYPKSNIKRDELIARICKIHAKYGEEYGVGLGFYSFTRFHIDTKSFRRWGPDGRSKTSPCLDYDKYVTKIIDNETAIE